jgi:hypothetical protein
VYLEMRPLAATNLLVSRRDYGDTNPSHLLNDLGQGQRLGSFTRMLVAIMPRCFRSAMGSLKAAGFTALPSAASVNLIRSLAAFRAVGLQVQHRFKDVVLTLA